MDRTEHLENAKSFIQSLKGELVFYGQVMLAVFYLHTTSSTSSTILTNLKAKLRMLLNSILLSLKVNIGVVEAVDVVLWPVSVSHVNQIYPVSKALKDRGIRYVWITNKTKIAAKLQSLHEKFIMLPIASRNFTKERNGSNGTNNNEYYGILNSNMKFVQDLIHINQTLIDSGNPKVLIVGNDLTPEGRAASLVFKRNKVFTCCIQHGDVSGVLESEHIVDEYYAYGEVSSGILRSKNPNLKTLVTGAPYLDEIDYVTDSTEDIQRLLKLRKAKYILVVLSGAGYNTSLNHHVLIVEALYRFASLTPEIDIVIKLHAKDKADHYDSFKELKHVRLVPFFKAGFPTSIFNWLKGASMVITGTSTAALEAMVLQIPVLTIDLMNEFEGKIDFIVQNCTVRVNDSQALKKTVDQFLLQPELFSDVVKKASEYAKKYFYVGSESASNSIVNRLSERVGI